jgi:HEAT repeat protein
MPILISASILVTLAIIFPIIAQGNSVQSPAAEANDVDQLIKDLKDPDSDVRKEAAISLRGLGDVKAVDALISALGDDNWSVRMIAAGALGDLGDGRALQPLIHAMNDEHKYVRSSAARALGELGDLRAITPLIKALSHEDPLTRSAAADSLGKLGDSRAVEPLIQSLSDEWGAVRSSAASALGPLGDARAVEPLIKALADEGIMGYVVRKSAASSLGQLGDARAVEPLVQALNDEESSVRWNAAKALGELGESSAIDPLIAALDDEDKDVVFWASYSLAKLGKTEYVDSLLVFLKDEEAYIRREAAEALGNLRDSRAVEPLIEALGDKDSYVRALTATALGEIGDARAKAPLQSAQDDEDSNVRRAVATALEKLNLAEEENKGKAVPAGTQQVRTGKAAVPAQESLTQTIGPEGGSINLSDGIKIIFPAGSVDRDMEVSASKIDSSAYLKDDLYNGVVIAVDNQERKLNKPAEIRVPLPSYIGLDDGNLVSGGAIDESTGMLTVEDCRIEAFGKGVEAVLSADHFSNKFVEYFKEEFFQEPVECEPLTVPYYEQGGPWCWAASTLMVCQAVKLKEDAQVFDVIGKVGLDETGMDNINVLSSYVKGHTDLSPHTVKWKFGSQLADSLRTYIRKQLAFKHNPVMVATSKNQHAWVVVGYDGDMFYVHDSQDPQAMPPYTKMRWGNEEEGLCKLWTVESVATMVVPEDISSKSYPVSLNLLGEGEISFNSINPKTNKPITHAFRWTNSKSGYRISGPGGIDEDGLPADITELSVGGISVANPDRKSARQVTISIEVMDQEEKNKREYGASKSQQITVPPASVVHLAFDTIKVSNFYIEGVNKYKFRTRALEEEKQVAEAVFLFEFKPRGLTKIHGCLYKDCSNDPNRLPDNWITGSCTDPAPGIQVDLVFTYIPPEYAKNTPSTMTTTSDDKGFFYFEVPPGSKYKVTVVGKEYDESYAREEGPVSCIEI